MTSILKAPISKSPAVIKQLSSFKQVTRGLGTTYLFQLTCLLHFHGSGWGSTGCAGRVTHPLCSQHPRLDCWWPWGESCDLAVDILPLAPTVLDRLLVPSSLVVLQLTPYLIVGCEETRDPERNDWLGSMQEEHRAFYVVDFRISVMGNLTPSYTLPFLALLLPTPPDFRALFLCIVELSYFQCPFSELCCLF